MLTPLAKVDIGSSFQLKSGNLRNFTNIRDFISQILPNIYVFAGLIVLVLIIIAGVGIVRNAGNPDAQQKSKGLLQNAIIGFLLIFASYWIIQIIEVLTGIDILGK